jgi:hypothetical protein
MNIEIHDRDYLVQVRDFADEPSFAILYIKFGAEEGHGENVIKLFCDGTNQIRSIAQSIMDECDKVQDKVTLSPAAIAMDEDSKQSLGLEG